MSFLRDPVIDEQFAHLKPEQAGHAQRERQAGVIFVGFDRVDRLARHAEPAGQFALAPPRAFAMFAYPIFQRPAFPCKGLFKAPGIACQTILTPPPFPRASFRFGKSWPLKGAGIAGGYSMLRMMMAIGAMQVGRASV